MTIPESPKVETAADGTRARLARVVFMLGAVGEIGVGVAVVVVPQIGPILIAAPLDASGLLVARMLGGAVLALGITWWLARGEAAAISRCAAGFLVYNVTVGALFVAAALATTRPVLPALLGAAHLLAGVVFGGAFAVRRGGGSAA